MISVEIFAQYWDKAPNVVRDAIRANSTLPGSRIHLFTEGDCDLSWLKDTEVATTPVSSRITYSNFLNILGNSQSDYAILLNSDIVVHPGTLEKIPNFSTQTALSVSRREVDGSLPSSTEGTNPSNCQDVWVFRPHTPTTDLIRTCNHIKLGRPGCENRFAAELAVDGYAVYNPCTNLVFTHMGGGAVDSYPDPADPNRYNGLYAYLSPCSTFDIDNIDYRQFLQYYPKVRGIW